MKKITRISLDEDELLKVLAKEFKTKPSKIRFTHRKGFFWDNYGIEISE